MFFTPGFQVYGSHRLHVGAQGHLSKLQMAAHNFMLARLAS